MVNDAPAPRRRRTAILLAIAVLVAGPALAPRLDPGVLFPISIIWLLVLLGLVLRVLRAGYRTMGWLGVLALVALGAGVATVVGRDWEGALGTRAPCRRNWGWLPSYLLRSSPTRSVTFEVGDRTVKVCYGSPRARGRKMIGGSPVPFGHLWRTGANEPTTIRTSGPITIGGIRLDAGKASLYTVPGPETWEIILNRSTGQWGIESEYGAEVEAAELGRTVVPSGRSASHQEAFTISVEPGTTPDSAVLVLNWETTLVRLPVATVQP